MIKLNLPQGDSFILARKINTDYYEISVFLPWYREKFFAGCCSWVIYDKLNSKEWRNIINAPTSDLISIIRKTVPIIKEQNIELDLEC